MLRAAYDAAGSTGFLDLNGLSAKIGRLKSNVCRKARQMGLETSHTRKHVAERKDRRVFKGNIVALKAHTSARVKAHFAAHGHPRGALGMVHTPEAKAKISEKSKRKWDAMTPEERQGQLDKMYYGARASGGGPPKIGRGTWKAGWREIGGKRNYYRSRWEANYARYLQWLKERGEIAEWAHEPETFWFDAIKRGVRSYKPDFRVWEPSGASCLHEVKGWMDGRSKTTLSRMAKYHPDQKIVLIDGVQYRSIRRAVMNMIPGWEDSARDNHA